MDDPKRDWEKLSYTLPRSREENPGPSPSWDRGDKRVLTPFRSRKTLKGVAVPKLSLGN